MSDPARRQFLLKGKSVDRENGSLQHDPLQSVTFEPIYIHEGETVSSDRPFRLYFYLPQIRPELIHTYTYDPYSNYTLYDPALSVFEEVREWQAPRDGYIRLVFFGSPEERIDRLVRFPQETEEVPEQKPWFQEEQQRLLQRYAQQKEEGDTCLLLLSDTHYGYGCAFPDTVINLKELAKEIHPQALIHLGDLSDGAQSSAVSREMAQRVLDGLKESGLPVYLCIGNHDGNYFRGNKDVFSRKENEELYLNGEREDRRIDLPQQKLSLLFLSSFDPKRKHRYGFSLPTILRLCRLLLGKPQGHRLLVFSHVPPLGELHYWDPEIFHSELLLKVLERHQKRHHDILAYIHGHNHADSVYTKRSFPIVGIASNKPEDFQDHKPAGTCTPLREPDTASQECFDVLLVKKEKVLFLRYGAGEDREV
ncbi:MAG: metallophosphoesterase [Erysipelotrichaceae bacterium]|nr:metallophosphoesterase [Erysipelotrichaceae bacterium]